MEGDIGGKELQTGLDDRHGLFVPLQGHGGAVDTVKEGVVLRIAPEEVAIHFRRPFMLTGLLEALG